MADKRTKGKATISTKAVEEKSLRDWFAGMALSGIMANRYLPMTGADLIAQEAYRTADFMLKERGK